MRKNGFTLVELIVAISVIAILAAITTIYISRARDNTYLTKATTELTMFANATRLYIEKYHVYPPDAYDANIPSEINEFIASEDIEDNWPHAPWPGSTYDYESWDVDGDGKDETRQMSIRFCNYPEATGPGGAELCKSRAPKEPWAENFNSNDNSFYYCLSGYCRPNEGTPWDYPGYCINCPDNKGIKKPGE